MAERDLSPTEIWDDSALVSSWNEALEEYKKYHSLAAKGEKVPLVSKDMKKGLVNGDEPASVIKNGPDAEQDITSGADKVPDLSHRVTAGPQVEEESASAPALPAIPQALAGTVKDENLKNIMMSWYYAGYYTGLYEGKQQGYFAAHRWEG